MLRLRRSKRLRFKWKRRKPTKSNHPNARAPDGETTACCSGNNDRSVRPTIPDQRDAARREKLVPVAEQSAHRTGDKLINRGQQGASKQADDDLLTVKHLSGGERAQLAA